LTQPRKAGDTAVIETSTDYTVVYFLKRRAAGRSAGVRRHVLISADRETSTAANWKRPSQSGFLLAAITDEASFIEMFKAESDDVASVRYPAGCSPVPG
jgi:hypothetical protein